MTRLDTDDIAILVRIYGTPAEQAQLLRQTRIIRGQLCPECGAEEAESNGCAGSDEEFRCCTCDHRWAPIDISLELPAAAPVDDADFDIDLALDAAECKGHPAGSHGMMGETTYCDGSCRRGHGPLDFDPFASTSAAPPLRPRLKGTGPRSLNRDDAAVAERDNRRVLKGGRQMEPLTFADRLDFAATRATNLFARRSAIRLALRARHLRLRRWTIAAPSAGMGAEAMPRQLRWPWSGGYMALARDAGFEVIGPGRAPQISATCSAPTAAASTSTFTAAIAA